MRSRGRHRTAGFQTCCIADFQIGWAWKCRAAWIGGRPAGLETRDTADWDVCGTGRGTIVPQVSKPAVSPISKSAGCGNAERLGSADGQRVWKPAIQQTGTSAVRGAAPLYRRFPNLLYRRFPNRLGVEMPSGLDRRTASGFGNPRYGRLGRLRYGARHHCTAGFQTCCIADFQIGWAWKCRAAWIGGRPAGLETRDTADWDVCGTGRGAIVPQVSKPAGGQPSFGSPISKSAGRGNAGRLGLADGQRVWKPAIQQTGTSAVRGVAPSPGLNRPGAPGVCCLSPFKI
jgi:hypothetical protein